MDASTINLKGYHDAKLGKKFSFIYYVQIFIDFQWVGEPRALYLKLTSQGPRIQWPLR